MEIFRRLFFGGGAFFCKSRSRPSLLLANGSYPSYVRVRCTESLSCVPCYVCRKLFIRLVFPLLSSSLPSPPGHTRQYCRKVGFLPPIDNVSSFLSSFLHTSSRGFPSHLISIFVQSMNIPPPFPSFHLPPPLFCSRNKTFFLTVHHIRRYMN